jgi:hypothetical protein
MKSQNSETQRKSNYEFYDERNFMKDLMKLVGEENLGHTYMKVQHN